MISILYFLTLIIVFLLFSEEHPSFKSRLPQQFQEPITQFSDLASSSFAKHKINFHIALAILAAVQILVHLRFPRSKGDIFSILFEFALYGLTLIFSLYLVKMPFNEWLKDNPSTVNQTFAPWVDKAYYWTYFRADQILIWILGMHLIDIVSSLF